MLVSHLVPAPELPDAEEHEPTLRCCSGLAAPLRACDAARAARATRTRGAIVRGLLLLRMQFITLDNMAYVHEVRGESRGKRGMLTQQGRLIIADVAEETAPIIRITVADLVKDLDVFVFDACNVAVCASSPRTASHHDPRGRVHTTRTAPKPNRTAFIPAQCQFVALCTSATGSGEGPYNT